MNTFDELIAEVKACDASGIAMEDGEFECKLASAVMKEYNFTKAQAENIAYYAIEDVSRDNQEDAVYVAKKYAKRFTELQK